MTSIPQRNEDHKDRKARQARERRAAKRNRKMAFELLDEMKVLAVQEAICRAPRSEAVTTEDGRVRTYRIGAHVAAMIRQLLHWEGKGAAAGAWIYKSEAEWLQSDAALTSAKLRTARKVGKEEGLWEEKVELRSSDRRQIVHYRLNMWRVAQVVVESELVNTRDLLKREKRKHILARLRKKLCKLETARDDLSVLDEPETANPQPEVRCVTEGTAAMPIDKGNLRVSKADTAQVASDTPAKLAGVPSYYSGPTGEDYSEIHLSDDTPVGTNASPVVDEFVSGPEQEQEQYSWEDHVQEEARLIYGRLKREGVPEEGSEYTDLLDVLRRGEELPGPDVLSEWLIVQYEQDGYLDPELAWFGAEDDSDDSSKDRRKELEELMAATVSKCKIPRGYEEEDL